MNVHSFYQPGDTLKIAITAAEERYISYLVIYYVKMDLLSADSFWSVIHCTKHLHRFTIQNINHAKKSCRYILKTTAEL